jgi:high-temperature-induced dauer-formation protein
LREFTLEGGREEIEKQAQLRKEQSDRGGRANSLESLRTPITARSPHLSDVPEDSAFAIGDDDSDEGETAALVDHQAYPSTSGSPRPASISSTDETLPVQLRGMSEKARGKMPAGQNSFSRQNSISSIQSLHLTTSHPGSFQPTAEWVGFIGLF